MPENRLSTPELYSSRLDATEEKRLSELFAKLDVNKDGKIDIHDLSEALQQLRVPQIPGQAEVRDH